MGYFIFCFVLFFCYWKIRTIIRNTLIFLRLRAWRCNPLRWICFNPRPSVTILCSGVAAQQPDLEANVHTFTSYTVYVQEDSRNVLITAHEMVGKSHSGPSLTHLKAFVRNIKKAKEHQHLRVTGKKKSNDFDHWLIRINMTSMKLSVTFVIALSRTRFLGGGGAAGQR